MNLQLSGLRRPLATLPILLAAAGVVTPAAAQVVTADLNVGTSPYAIAVNASTNRIYVTDTALNAVSVINGATNAIASVPVGVLPQAIAVNPVTNTIYVANSGGLVASNTLTVINGSTNAATTLTLGAGALQPDSIAVNTATNKVYVATYAGPIAVIDGASNAISTVNAAAGTNPVAIAVDISANKVFVACTPTSILLPATATLTVIDGASNTTATVAAGPGLFAVQVNASLNQVFLGSVLNNALTELSALTNATLGSVLAGAPKCIAVNPNTGIVYYVSSVLGNVVAYNPSSGVTTTLTVASAPLTGQEAIAIDAGRNKIYVANSLGITAIDGATNAVKPVLTGLASSAITLNPTTGQVYVADALGQLTVVDPLTTHLVVSATGPATIGSPVTVTVTAEDASGATVAGYVGTVHLSSSDLLANLPANQMLTNGSATFSVTLNTAGSATISAADVLSASISGTSSALSVAAAAAAIPTPTPTPTTTPTPTPTPTPSTGSSSSGSGSGASGTTVSVGSSGSGSSGSAGVTVSTGSTGSSSGSTPGSGSTSIQGTLGTDSSTTISSTVSTGTSTATPITTAPLVSAAAPSQDLDQGGVLVLKANATGADSYQWYFNGVPLTDGVDVSGAQTSSLMIIGVTSANAGNYTYTATNSLGTTTSAVQSVSIVAASNFGRLVNISCRSQVGTGGNVLIAGFIVGGDGTSGTEPVLVRASGPALTQFGVTGVLPDPQLLLYSGDQVVASDTQWADDSAINATAQAVGAFQWTSADGQNSALMQSVPSGAYTAQVTGASGDTGVALAEVYDATPANAFTATSPRLVNISARVKIGSGSGTLIAGFVIGGSTSCTVMVRATGPGLGAFGISDYLPDPQVALYSGTTEIASNQGWQDNSQVSWASGAVGAFPWDAQNPDAAILITLAPGAYTAQVSGISGDTGVALVEVYEVR